MAHYRNEKNRSKLKGALDERINSALYILAEHPDVLEIEVSERPIRHSKNPDFEIRKVYQTVRGAVLNVALLGRKGYGKVVDIVTNNITDARNVAEYIHNIKRKGPLEYFPA